MLNITYDVWRTIDQELVIRKALELGIVNVRAVALCLIKEHEMDASVDAVISAIRRYPLSQRKKMRADSISNVLKNSKISTKTKIASITTKREPVLLAEFLPKIFKLIDPSKGEVLRLVEGRESLKIVVDESKLDSILKTIGKHIVNEIKKDLCEINIHFGEGQEDIRGIRASILTELAINEVAVIETISCLPEFMLLIKEEDMAKAHNLLINFCYQK